MKKNVFLWAALAAAALLAACGKSPHSVQWYKEHAAEREAMVKQCLADREFFKKNTQECQNAGDAAAAGGQFTPSPERKW
ncbi:EexN family lipoprotein [Burkholderia cenocepacia]|uniref:EexN family lipoprotein n=1 Tax=Burkholderia cenocepacia TaxID=95486 RepID=UPI002ABD39DC|nr:EexN family lipoprotein [Burkholderia cenocepacia]